MPDELNNGNVERKSLIYKSLPDMNQAVNGSEQSHDVTTGDELNASRYMT